MQKERIIEVLNSELRYMILVSLISADSNITEEDIQRNLGNLEEIKAVTEDKRYADKINDLEEVIDFIDRGFAILNRDLENLKGLL